MASDGIPWYAVLIALRGVHKMLDDVTRLVGAMQQVVLHPLFFSYTSNNPTFQSVKVLPDGGRIALLDSRQFFSDSYTPLGKGSSSRTSGTGVPLAGFKRDCNCVLESGL
jgi:hypothetical protein